MVYKSSESYEQKHLERLRALAPDCMVLLRSNGAFPLDAPGPLALYGSGARHTVKGGTGSGDVNVRRFSTVEQGLEAAGFTLTTKAWLDGYDAIRAQTHAQFIADIKREARQKHTFAALIGMGAVMREPDYLLPLDGAGDTAVYVLSRVSGEGSDRTAQKGDLRLSDTEVRDILACRDRYPRFMLVLNTAAPIDLSPVMQVENILLLSQLGSVIGDAFADVLLGRAAPGGKLTATWNTAPAVEAVRDFGEADDTRYREGIYVGYRYADSAGQKPLFPFGHGLTYTRFDCGAPNVSLCGTAVTLRVPVRNIGAHTGRETLQLYVTAPWGRLDQPYQKLAAFAKTDALAPGAAQTVTLRFALEDIASYDEARAALLLEAGGYILRLGTSSADTRPCALLTLGEEVIVRQVARVGGSADFADWKPEHRWADEVLPDGLPCLAIDPAAFAALPLPVRRPLPREAAALAARLPNEALAHLLIGAAHESTSLIAKMTGSPTCSVAGAAGGTSRSVTDVPALVLADGPAGLRLSRDYIRTKKGVTPLGDTLPAGLTELMPAFIRPFFAPAKPGPRAAVLHQYCTALPVGTALAQSWDPALAEACGDIVGAEMERFGVQLWLAPGMNIQRHPLCGRNFEYYAEDPLLTGCIAAGITRGVQQHPGCGVTIKHFCANNQETNRHHSNSIVSPRALREIYLAPFARCIREAAPHAVMSSYNLLNGTHTSERSDLLRVYLQNELGWNGLIMTDWLVGLPAKRDVRHPDASVLPALAAGTQLYMPGTDAAYRQTLNALRRGTLPRAQAEDAAAHVIAAAQLLARPKR